MNEKTSIQYRLREALRDAIQATACIGASRSGIETATHRATLQGVKDRFEDILKELPEWLPIESAPKDGTKILIHTDRLGYAVVHHDEDDYMPTDIVPSGHSFVVEDGKFGPYAIRGDYPKYWCALPAWEESPHG